MEREEMTLWKGWRCPPELESMNRILTLIYRSISDLTPAMHICRKKNSHTPSTNTSTAQENFDISRIRAIVYAERECQIRSARDKICGTLLFWSRLKSSTHLERKWEQYKTHSSSSHRVTIIWCSQLEKHRKDGWSTRLSWWFGC